MASITAGVSWQLQGLGLLTFLCGVVLTRADAYGEVALAEGQPFDGAPASFLVTAGTPPQVAFEPVVIERVMQGDDLLGYHAEIRLEGRETTDHVGGQRPLATAGAEVHLRRVDLAPVFSLTDTRSGQQAMQCANLNVWSAGAPEDGFQPAPGLTATVRFYPDFVDADGTPSSKSQVMRNPVLAVAVHGDGEREPIASALLHKGQKMAVGDYELRLEELRRWGLFAVVRPSGLDWRLVGLGVLGAGILLGAIAWLRGRVERPGPGGGTDAAPPEREA